MDLTNRISNFDQNFCSGQKFNQLKSSAQFYYLVFIFSKWQNCKPISLKETSTCHGVYNPKNNVIVRGGGMLLFYGLQKCQVYGLLNEPNGIHHQPPSIAGQRKSFVLWIYLWLTMAATSLFST